MSSVKWTPSALSDLQNIREYIAYDSVYYADIFVNDAFSATEQLELFPEMGRIVPEIGDPAVRELIHGSYRIIYEVIENNAHIVTIVHGKRLLPEILNNPSP